MCCHLANAVDSMQGTSFIHMSSGVWEDWSTFRANISKTVLPLSFNQACSQPHFWEVGGEQ